MALLPGDDEPRELLVDPLADLRDPEVRRTLLVHFADRFEPEERARLAEGLDGPLTPRPRTVDRDRWLP